MYGTRASEPTQPSAPGLRLGLCVAHPRFGIGIVMDAEGSGAHARLQLNFENAGPKWLVMAFANLLPA